MKKRVLISGGLLTQSGYGVHTRQIYKFCESVPDWELFCDPTPWGTTPWNFSNTDEEGLYSRIVSKALILNNQKEKFDISIQVKLPNEWNENLAHFNVGVTACVETDICSREWATTHREKMNVIIVPSEFTKKTLQNSGTGKEKTPIFVIQESFYKDLLLEPTADPLANIETSKNFLTVGTLTDQNPQNDRKNILNTIVWFRDAFNDSKDVGLIVKTSLGRDTTIDRENVRTLLKNMKKQNSNAKVYLVHGSMTQQEMTNLYKSKKLIGYVSPTRGEGFGLPLLEAAVTGLPVVATDWSAHTEFLSGDSFIRVAYDITKVNKEKIDGNIFVQNSLWAEPRQNNFKRSIRFLYQNSDTLKTQANALSTKLIDNFNEQTISKKYETLFKSLNLC